MEIQILDVDYTVPNETPVVRIFGKTESGESRCVFVEDFLPYFYVLPKNKEKLINSLNKRFPGEIKEIKNVEKYLPKGYSKEKKNILKIINRNPSKVPSIRDFLKERNLVEEIFEADILFKYRFLVDHNLSGMDWIKVNGKPVRTDTVKSPAYKAIEIEKIEKEENSLLKYMAFDIECLPQDEDRMVDADKDPILLISVSFQPKYRNKKSFVLVSKLGNNKNAEHFKDEKEMLERFLEIIKDYDPDIVTGYNVENFDFPYLIKRLELLGIDKDLGRCSKSVFSRKFGNWSKTQISGRVIVDSYSIIKRDPYQRFIRYDLDTVANEMLGEGKKDVDWKEMRDLWESKKEGLDKFIEYSEKDSILALDLVIEKDLLSRFFELSKISGLLLEDSTGGQTMRIDNRLLREFKNRDILMPCKPTNKEVKKRKKKRKESGLKGGLVLEPEKGLHTDGHVVVLDFKSLYPSVMRTYNICPTTLLREDNEEVEFQKSPSGTKFVKKDSRKGIIPQVAGELIEARNKVKEKMRQEENKEKKKMLNARQLALKDMSNSIYGYTGYVRTRLYLMDVANAITSYGRDLISKTKKEIEENFDVKVIYGDTDSVMLKTKTNNLENAYEIGKEIPEFINNRLPGFLKLEFEKLFRSFLILTKKRYAGWSFVRVNGKWEDKIEMKGIETVRRDWCKLVSETMNKVLKVILKEGDIEKAIENVQRVVEDVKEGKIDLEKLSVVKSITKRLKRYDGKLPHIELAKKIKERDPSNAPTPGERIPYVIIKGNQILSKRAEHPDYVVQKNLRIDSEYYIKSQLLPPLERIFSVVGVDKQELLGKGRQTSLEEMINDKKEKRNHDVSITRDPSQRIIKNLQGFVCKECDEKFRRPPLIGKCSCGGEIYASSPGSIGKVIEFEDGKN